MADIISQYGYMAVAFVVGAGLWWFIAPHAVRQTNPRLRHRNPSHYRRLVKFYRAWGIGAVLLGILLVIGLGPEG